MKKAVAFSLFALFLAASSITQSAESEFKERWIYVATNHLVDANVDKLEALMRRAATAGYSGVQLNDSKFNKLDDLGDLAPRYFKNVERIKKLAVELKLDLIPGVMPIGYSNDMLWHDPNLVEALPVVDAPYVVKGGVARIVPDERDFKKIGFKDDHVSNENGIWKTVDAGGKNSRVSFKFAVQPVRQYHISVKIKTDDFHGNPEVKILAGGKSLAWANLGVKPTQDWTVHHQVFNSQDFKEVQIYFGCWGAGKGTLQFKEAHFEEASLVNAVRRPGAPFKITTEDGTLLSEGKDFDKFADPLTGTKPYKGNFDVYHQPPELKTHLPDGTKLKVSYYHAMTVYDGQVMVCPSEPKTWDLLKRQALEVHKLFNAKKYFMHFDEIRVLNHCAACRDRKLTPGQIIADAAKQATQIMRETAPGATLYTWNDMFDPNHNAVEKNYYLVNGDLRGSWEGLDKDVVIVAWLYGKREESCEFFSKRGNRLLAAGYYDGGQDVAKWLETLKKFPGSVGIMYTTWQQKYGEMENFMKKVDEVFQR